METTLDEDVSIHDKLMAKLNPEPPEDVQDEVEPTPEPEEVEEVSEGEEEVVEQIDETPETQAYDLNQVADIIGFETDQLDVNDDGELMFKTKVGDEESYTTLKQLIKERQLEGHLNRQNIEVVELKKQLQSQLEESQTKAQQQIEDAEAVIAAVYSNYLQEFEGIDWNDLKENDREEYLFKKQEMDARKQFLVDSYQKITANKPKPDPEAYQKQISEARMTFAKTIPEWTTEEVVSKEWSEMNQYAQSKGITEDQFYGVADPHVLTFMRNSMLYERLMAEKPRITKQVRTAPKIVKSSNKPPPSKDDAEMKKLQADVKAGKPGALAQMLLKKGLVK